MGWVLILIGLGGVDGISLATAQFENETLCQAAAQTVRERVDVGGQPAVAGICLPATEAAVAALAVE